MLFRSISGTIPKNTVSAEIEIKFQRQKGHSAPIFGMADNLRFIIEKKEL